MSERKIDLVGVLNREITTSLEVWKTSLHSESPILKLNTLFELAEKMGLDTTIEVDEKEITKVGDDFPRILPEEAAVYEGENGSLRVLNIPPTLADPERKTYILCASISVGEPALVCYHIERGETGRFRPTDVVSITLH